MCLNHPDLVHKHPTPLWDGVVRVGSMCLNHPEVVTLLLAGECMQGLEARAKARGGGQGDNLYTPLGALA